MTLYQVIVELVARWDGSDAAERSENRRELLTALLVLLQPQAARPAPIAAPAKPARDQAA